MQDLFILAYFIPINADLLVKEFCWGNCA